MSTPYRSLPPPLGHTPPALTRVEFAWGTLVERRCRHWVVWDFCLTPLRQSFLDAGLSPEVCQSRVFQALEGRFNCTTRDLVTLLERVETWVLFPSASVSTFSLVVHCAWEQEARRWVVQALFPVLPPLIAQVRQGLTHPQTNPESEEDR